MEQTCNNMYLETDVFWHFTESIFYCMRDDSYMHIYVHVFLNRARLVRDLNFKLTLMTKLLQLLQFIHNFNV